MNRLPPIGNAYSEKYTSSSETTISIYYGLLMARYMYIFVRTIYLRLLLCLALPRLRSLMIFVSRLVNFGRTDLFFENRGLRLNSTQAKGEPFSLQQHPVMFAACSA